MPRRSGRPFHSTNHLANALYQIDRLRAGSVALYCLIYEFVHGLAALLHVPLRRLVGILTLLTGTVALLIIYAASLDTAHPRGTPTPAGVRGNQTRTQDETARLIDRGHYLATIGVCEACHTPPAVSPAPPDPADTIATSQERMLRTDPDWFDYLDPQRRMAGGVPFILRLSATSSGVVYTSNITPDPETGLGTWSEDDIVRVLRTGIRKDGSVLFLFTPHSYFRNLAEEDARALAVYLKSLPPVRNAILPRSLPFSPVPATDVSPLLNAPEGRTNERARYLMSSIVGCKECHGYQKDGQHYEFVGGDRVDPFTGVFRLGPDLPLRQTEKGFAAFPYPGYALLYGGNLTRYGRGGDLNYVSNIDIVRALRLGISPVPDKYGRPKLLAHTMMWQFYSSMTDEDAYAIAEYIKMLQYVPHDNEPRLVYFGDDWEAAFEYMFGEKPSAHDREIFGKDGR